MARGSAETELRNSSTARAADSPATPSLPDLSVQVTKSLNMVSKCVATKVRNPEDRGSRTSRLLYF
jgi:hypothetical protein